MKINLLPNETTIEVISINKVTKEVSKKEMSFFDWLNLKKNSNYTYTAFQKGFSQF